MRALLVTLLMFFSLSAMANCKVYIPVKYFTHISGQGFGFDFTAILKKKNYQETDIPQEANYQINLSGHENQGRINKATAYLEMLGRDGNVIKTEKTVVCFSQSCAVRSFDRAFNQAIKKLSKLIPVCR